MHRLPGHSLDKRQLGSRERQWLFFRVLYRVNMDGDVELFFFLTGVLQGR